MDSLSRFFKSQLKRIEESLERYGSKVNRKDHRQSSTRYTKTSSLPYTFYTPIPPKKQQP